MVTVKANIDPTRRAGELTEDEMKKIDKMDKKTSLSGWP